MQYVRMLVNCGILVFQCIAKQRGRCMEACLKDDRATCMDGAGGVGNFIR
jgi:hypothetical protein